MLFLICRKDTTFPRNFQGFREKILEKGEENEKNRRLPELRVASWILLFRWWDDGLYTDFLLLIQKLFQLFLVIQFDHQFDHQFDYRFDHQFDYRFH